MIYAVLIATLITAGPVASDLIDRADTAIAERRWDRARELLEDALQDPSAAAQALVPLTRVCTELEEIDAAVAYGKRAIQEAPRSSTAHLNLAVALRYQMSTVGNRQAAFILQTYTEVLERALELDPSNARARAEHIGFLIHAPEDAGGSLEHAEEELDTLEQQDWPGAQQLRMALELERDDPAAAAAAGAALLEQTPNDTQTRLTVALLLLRAEQYRTADDHLAHLQANADRDTALTALYQRGRARILGDFDLATAVELLSSYLDRRQADDLDLPPPAAAHWRIGMAHELQGNTAAARTAYQTALDLDPGFQHAAAALAHLDQPSAAP
jgi:tetratricopeptide (TPR) repeat protein